MSGLEVVASFTDAWIETAVMARLKDAGLVASFTDAWIETAYIRARRDEILSHLLQMRGLKHFDCTAQLPISRRIFYRCVD